MKWTVETLNPTVDAEFDQLPPDMRARFIHVSRLIEEFGLERVREPHVSICRDHFGKCAETAFPALFTLPLQAAALSSFACSLRKLKKLLSRRLNLRCDAQRRCRNEQS
jgi:hypothetical protein